MSEISYLGLYEEESLYWISGPLYFDHFGSILDQFWVHFGLLMDHIWASITIACQMKNNALLFKWSGKMVLTDCGPSNVFLAILGQFWANIGPIQAQNAQV